MRLQLRRWNRTTSTAITFAIDSAPQTPKKSALRAARPSLTLFFAICGFLNIPFFAYANVQITEVMYDAPGSDSGREWIEITNTGLENVDVGKYKLFENGTNHGLKIISGATILLPGISAIIASDAQKFLLDYPTFSGVLFDSAFSLSNEGESLALKDEKLQQLDIASYTSSEEAKGTGGSLQIKENTFVAALASPGIFPGEFRAVLKKESATPPSSAKKISQKKQVDTSPYIPDQPSAVAQSFEPTLPSYALWLLGLFAILLCGVAGVLFLSFSREETYLTADEFKIE